MLVSCPMATLKRRTAVAAFWVNLPLSAGKIGVGRITGSHALVADGVHSLSDLIGDVAVYLAALEALPGVRGCRDLDTRKNCMI